MMGPMEANHTLYRVLDWENGGPTPDKEKIAELLVRFSEACPEVFDGPEVAQAPDPLDMTEEIQHLNIAPFLTRSMLEASGVPLDR